MQASSFESLALSVDQDRRRACLGLFRAVGARAQAAVGEDRRASRSAFGVIQLALTPVGGFQIMNDFDRGLLFQACTMTMVALGLNLIYGFNGQFSLGQWGFYGIGAYTRPTSPIAGSMAMRAGCSSPGCWCCSGAVIWAVGRLIKRYKGMPVLSQFTLYLIGTVAGRRGCRLRRQCDRRGVGGRFRRGRCSGLPAERAGAAGGLLPGGGDRRRVRRGSQLPVRPARPDPRQRLLRHRHAWASASSCRR